MRILSVLILTRDIGLPDTINRNFFPQKKFKIIFEQDNGKAILRILDHTIDAVIIDITDYNVEFLYTIKVLRHIKPSLPIISIYENENIELLKEMSEYGILYFAPKLEMVDEIEKIFKAIENVYRKQIRDTIPRVQKRLS